VEEQQNVVVVVVVVADDAVAGNAVDKVVTYSYDS